VPTTAEFAEYLKADIRPGETYDLWKARLAGERPDPGSVSAPQTQPEAGQPVQNPVPESGPQETPPPPADERRRAAVRTAGADALKPGSVQGYIDAGMALGEEGYKTKGVAAIPESNIGSFKILTSPEDPEEIEKLAKADANDPRLHTPQAKAVLRDMVRRDFGIEVPPTAALTTWRTLSAAPKKEAPGVDGAKLTPGVLPAVQEYTKQAGKGKGLELPKVVLMSGEEAINVSRLRNDLVKFYTANAVKRAGASITADMRRQIDASAREIANSRVHEFIADNRDSSALFADTDPDGTTRLIAKEGYVPGVTAVTGLSIPQAVRDVPWPSPVESVPGTDLKLPDTVGEAVSPFLAVLSPYHHEVTFQGDTQQLVETEGKLAKLGYVARIAPSTVFGAWVASDGDWGSDEHIEKIRQGYDLGQSTRDVGEWWAKTVFGEDGAQNHPYFTRIMGVGSVATIMMVEPDPISVATVGAGKVGKAGVKAAKIARAEKFVSTFDKMLAEAAGPGFDVEKWLAKWRALEPGTARAVEKELEQSAGQGLPVQVGLAAKVEAAKGARARATKSASDVAAADAADRARIVSEGMATGKHAARVEAAEMDLRAAHQLRLSAEWALNRAVKNAADSLRAPRRTADVEEAGFKTSKGSTYTWDGAKTQRNKTPHAGHAVDDVGVKEVSDSTVFVSPNDAQRVGAHMALNPESKPRVFVDGDELVLEAWRGIGPDGKPYGIRYEERIPFTRSPALGRAPVEFLPRGKIHAGNEIVEMFGGGSRSRAPLIDALRRYGAAAQALENTYDVTPKAWQEFAAAREAVIKAHDEAAYKIAKQTVKRAGESVRKSERNLAAAVGANTGVNPEAAAKVAKRRAAALQKLEEANHAADFPERLREAAIDIATRHRDSWKKLAEQARNGAPDVARNPLPKVLQGTTAAGGAVDAQHLRSALDEAFGASVVTKFLNTANAKPLKDVIDHGGPVSLDGQQVAALYRAVDALDDFGAMVAQSDAKEAQALLDAITSPNTLAKAEHWITSLERSINKLKASADPITRKYGQLSQRGREAVMALTGMANRMKDELAGVKEMAEAEFGALDVAHKQLRDAMASGDQALVDDAIKRVQDAERGLHETLGKFLDGREPIKMGVGVTAMNVRKETIFQRFKRAVLSNVELAENPGGDASKEFGAVCRAWLPTDRDLDPAVAAGVQAAVYRALKSGRINNSAELFDFTKKVTAAMAGDTAGKPDRSLALAVAGVGFGSVTDDLVQLSYRTVAGVVDPQVAAAATDFVQRHGKDVKEAINPEAEFADISGLYDVFVRWGVPMFQRKVALDTGETKKATREFVRFVSKEGDGHVIIPATLMDGLREKFGKIEKELDVENVKGAPTAMDYFTGAWGQYLQAISTGMTVGLFLPKPKHYVNLLAGSFSQVFMTAGLPRALAVTAEGVVTSAVHSPGILPFLGPHYTAWIDHLQVKYGEKFLQPLSNAFLNPGVGAFYSGRSGTIKLGDRVWDLDDLRDRAIKRGILSAHVHEGLERTVGRHLGLWADAERLVRKVPGLGNSKGVSAAFDLAGKAGNLFGKYVSAAENRKAIAGLIEHRQRIATFLNHLNDGKSEEEAAQLTLDALYDWNHPVAIGEIKLLTMLVPFWRYHALSAQQLVKSALLPIVAPKSESMLKAMTGQTRLARTVRTASIAEEVPEWVHWAQDDEDSHAEWMQARAMVPWGAKQDAILDVTRRADGTWEYTRMPSLTALDKLGMFMSIGFGMAEATILAAKGEPGRAVQAAGEPVVEEVGELFHELTGEMFKAAAEYGGDIETFRAGGDWVNPRPGELDVFMALCPEAVVTIRGEQKVDAFTARVFRGLVPVASEIVQAYVIAKSDDPEKQKALTAAAGYTLRALLGFRGNQFSPAAEARKTQSFTVKDMKRAAGHEGIVAGAKR
jgi:hypothetical protein